MKTKVVLSSIFCAITLFAHADKYDDLEIYYEKLPQNEANSPTSNHFNLKHELFFDKTTSDQHQLKGTGKGWRGEYEYSSPNKPYFSLEGSLSSTDDMEWRGGISTTRSVKDEIEEKIRRERVTLKSDNDEKRVEKLREKLVNGQIDVIKFRDENYYSEDLIHDKNHIHAFEAPPLILDNDILRNGETFKRKLEDKIEGETYSQIRNNGKTYYRIKTDLQDSKPTVYKSLGSAAKTLKDVNAKFGTNWSFNDVSVTPYAGLGYRSVLYRENLLPVDGKDLLDKRPELHLSGKNDTYYGSLGAKFKYAFNPYFDLGLNGQINHGLFYDSDGFAAKPDKNLFSLVGYRTSLPISAHLGKKQKLDLQIEPYIDQFDAGHQEMNTGLRLSTGISF